VVWRFAKVHECWKRVALPCRHEGRRLTCVRDAPRQRGNWSTVSWAYSYWVEQKEQL
jgi:hypothetical protein